jgi:hypothetical protein
MNAWIIAIDKARAELERLNEFGWDVRHNRIKE